MRGPPPAAGVLPAGAAGRCRCCWSPQDCCSRLRGSVYFPLFLAFGGATLLKVALVVRGFVSTRWFQYVFILALLAVVARLLRVPSSASWPFPTRSGPPPISRGVQQFLCPLCEYPIRTGPRSPLWTRRTVHKVLPPPEAEGKGEFLGASLLRHAVVRGVPGLSQGQAFLAGPLQTCDAEKELPSTTARRGTLESPV